MKRINLVYGGIDYSIANRDFDELRSEISTALDTGAPYWLQVNHGSGLPREAWLLITAGTDLALLPIAGNDLPEALTAETPPPRPPS